MKFFHPQTQLARETVLDEPDAYYLHVVTFCPRTAYRNNGYDLDASLLENGVFKVNVKLAFDPALPDMEYITPVVHTIALGSIAFPGGEGAVEVQVTGDIPAGSGTSARGDNPPPPPKKGGKDKVSTIDADTQARPFPGDDL